MLGSLQSGAGGISVPAQLGHWETKAVSVHAKLPPSGSGEWEPPSHSPLPMSVSPDLARPAVTVGVRPETLHSPSAPGKADEAHPAGLHSPLAALWSCLPKPDAQPPVFNWCRRWSGLP